jgi:hypothetical protein
MKDIIKRVGLDNNLKKDLLTELFPLHYILPWSVSLHSSSSLPLSQQFYAHVTSYQTQILMLVILHVIYVFDVELHLFSR